MFPPRHQPSLIRDGGPQRLADVELTALQNGTRHELVAAAVSDKFARDERNSLKPLLAHPGTA